MKLGILIAFLFCPVILNCQIQLPIEVMVPAGTTVKTVQFTVPPGVNLELLWNLWLKIHGLEYETQASVQVNNSGWIPLDSAHVQLQGLANAYGGIGGGYSTLEMVVPLPAGIIKTGKNTISLRFNGTDGHSSGFRVVGFNFESTSVPALLSPAAFTQNDPATWTPPLNNEQDIAAGQQLWQTAALTQTNGLGGTVSLTAHCGDCHTHDGRDLKYFNYSNNTIETRAMFHGLNSTEARQIASYIRSLDAPAPANGRPWNPPYQPTPGLDELPVTDWAAGGGIDAVLQTDQDMLAYMTPPGYTAGWAVTGDLNARETPIAMQLPDWNHWLPRVYPGDAFSDFTSSQFVFGYHSLRALLRPGAGATASSISEWERFFDYWGGEFIGEYAPNVTPSVFENNPTLTTEVYSTSLWRMVKTWEIMQEFSQEGQNATLYQQQFGVPGDPRGWYQSKAMFGTAPHSVNIPPGIPGVLNGTVAAHKYLSTIWYEMQMILNDGSHTQQGSAPIDYGYSMGALKDVSLSNPPASYPQAGMFMFWMVKALQESNQPNPLGNILATTTDGNAGWNPNTVQPILLVAHDLFWSWSDTPAATRAAVSAAYLQNWLAKVQTFTPAQWYAAGWASPTYIPTNNNDANFGNTVWYMIPQLKYYGVDPNLLQQIVNWAQTVWPAANWNNTLNATCVPYYDGTETCTTQ